MGTSSSIASNLSLLVSAEATFAAIWQHKTRTGSSKVILLTRMRIALLLFLPMAGLAQSQMTTTTAQMNGLCNSTHPGNTRNLNITCSGLTPSQLKLLENIPAFLNRLLSSQTDTNSEMLLRLVNCVIEGTPESAPQNQEQTTSNLDLQKKSEAIIESGPRSISVDQKNKIIAALRNPPGKPELRIKATGNTAESSRYARQLHDTFSSVPGWTVPSMLENKPAETPAPPAGLTAYVQTDANVYGFALRRLFTELGIKIDFAVDPALGPELVVLVVGQVPTGAQK